jgi:hypothetical protein
MRNIPKRNTNRFANDRTADGHGFVVAGGGQAKIDARKRQFERLNDLAQRASAWLTSVCGATTVTFDALPSSPFAEDLRDLGYEVQDEGPGERILPAGIEEKFARRADGELELITEGSTATVVTVRHHAGITRVLRFSFDIA